MTKRLLVGLGLVLSLGAGMTACFGSSVVLEGTSSSSSGGGSGGAGGSSSSRGASSGPVSSSGGGFGGGPVSSSGGGFGGGPVSSSGGGFGGGPVSSSGGGFGGGPVSSSGAVSSSGSGGGTLYSMDFEGPCPDGWTLTGDWECGTPSNVGPPGAFSGTQCIATKIAGNYSDLQSWATTTATSPSIDLTLAPAPKLSFRMWMDTEGATFDGANLKISTNGGMSYGVVSSVVPAYSLTINGEPAWGGHQAALGWQLVSVDLSAYAGQIVRLRFAFRSDGASTYPGVYIDDVGVTDN